MKCESCNKICVQTSAESIMIEHGVFRTTRYYRCPKCGKEYKEVLEPVKV